MKYYYIKEILNVTKRKNLKTNGNYVFISAMYLDSFTKINWSRFILESEVEWDEVQERGYFTEEQIRR